LWSGALLAPLAFLPLLQHPVLALGIGTLVIVGVLATRSVAYPVALAAAPAILIGLIGHNPFPNGAVAFFMFAWTVFAIVLAVMADPAALSRRALASPPVILTIALGAWMQLRLGASPDVQYGSFKLRLFVAQNLTLLLAGVVIGRRRRDFDLFATLLLITAAASAIVLAKQLATGQAQATLGGRFSLYEAQSPIGLAREAATGLIVAAFMLLSRRPIPLRLLALAGAPVIAVAFVASGSRGPVIGLVVGLLVLLGLTLREAGTRSRVLLVAIGGIVAAILVTQLVPGQDITRSFSFLFGSSGGLSSNGRFALWRQAWDAFLAHPILGIGTGGFGQIDPVELYPHNLVLEAASELGLVGLVIVVGFVVFGVITLFRIRKGANSLDRMHAALAAALFAAGFMNSLISSDFAGNSALWLAAGLGLGIWVRSSAREPEPEPVEVPTEGPLPGLRRAEG